MEIWGELSLPSDPLALSDSNMFESIDDSEHDQYEDDIELDEQRLDNHALKSYVCNAAKALESVLSEALGKYPLLVLDEQTNNTDSMESHSNRMTTHVKDGKFRRAISASLFGESLESCDDANDLLEIWEETELDEEISSIEEEVERIQQQKYVIETTIPYSSTLESSCLFFEEYYGFLHDPEDIADSSSDCSSLSSPLPSPMSTPVSPQSPLPPTPPVTEEDSNHSDNNSHASGSSCEEDDIASPSNSIPSSPSNIITSIATEDHNHKSTKRRSELETPKPREKRMRKSKNKSITIAESLSVTVVENSSDSPSGKTWTPTRRRKSKKRISPKKKKMEEIFRSEQVLKIKAVEGDEVDVNVDIGDASDFTNY